MTDKKFTHLYKKLNAKQREAVGTIQGPVMVIAGPGTGKTSILTLRIANILRETDTAPESILALTFTESGAYSMRKRLVEIIGGTAYRVNIFTFHGFANYLIQRFSESFPRVIGGRPATVADQVGILEKIFLENRFKLIRPFGDIYYYLPSALRSIRDLKRENISPRDFARLLKDEEKNINNSPEERHTSGRFKGEIKSKFREQLARIEKSRELASVYEKYEKALGAGRLFDFEDMLLEVIRSLQKDKNFLLSLQEQYQYILADEHQDANNAQNKILELLCSFDDNPNLFIVGDEKQAIYRFQGASLQNFLYFRKKYPRSKIVELSGNYRSTQAILDASHSLIAKSNLPAELKEYGVKGLRPRLIGQVIGDKKDISFFEFSSSDAELLFLVHDISRKIKSGIKPSEIAVLFRDNADAFDLVEVLERTDINFSVFSDEDILSDKVLRRLFILLRAVNEPGNEQFFSEMLHLDFLNISQVDIYKVLLFCHSRRYSIFNVVSSTLLLKKAGIVGSSALSFGNIFRDFCRFSALAKNKNAGEAIEIIARESGFTKSLLENSGSLKSIERLDALFGELKELSEYRRSFFLKDFLFILDRLDKHGLRLSGRRNQRPEFLDSISLLTAHRAKGLEFDVVYIIRAVEGHWGGRRPRSTFYIPGAIFSSAESVNDDAEEERRLFFVALTRARKNIIITMSREGKGRPRLPSQFVVDIDSELFSKEDARSIEKSLQKQAPLYLRPKINNGPQITMKPYLQKIFLEQGLTVTALNNYLSCPWEYFFKNLVRLPKLPEYYLSYGNAVHEALRAFFDARAKRKVGKIHLIRFFDRALLKMPLPHREFSEYRRRGRLALLGYFSSRKDEFDKKSRNEVDISGVFLPFFASKKNRVNLLLRGKIDKISEDENGTLTVTDYKTGKPKSRTEIQKGNMKRQLDFYKLLLDESAPLGRNKETNMTVGIIDFIEPDSRGNYRREKFQITKDDVLALKELIKDTAKEIYNLEFWEKKCLDRKCEWCRLRDAIA